MASFLKCTINRISQTEEMTCDKIGLFADLHYYELLCMPIAYT
jgi:hypothetical protein